MGFQIGQMKLLLYYFAHLGFECDYNYRTALGSICTRQKLKMNQNNFSFLMVPQAYLANKISRDSLKQTTFKTILCYSGELAALLNSAFLPCLFFFTRRKRLLGSGSTPLRLLLRHLRCLIFSAAYMIICFPPFLLIS